MRVFCSTNRCTLLAAQMGHAQRTIATLRGLLEQRTAERDALAAQLAAARADAAFYMGLFCDAREETDRPQNGARTGTEARNGA